MRAGLHAQQRGVRLGVVAVRVVAVVGGEQRRADRARDAEQVDVDPVLLGQAVVLQLDEEVVAAEDLLEARGRGEGAVVVVLEEPLAHRAAEAAGRGDEALVVALEQLEVDAGLVVEAVEVRARRHLDEVVVALAARRAA